MLEVGGICVAAGAVEPDDDDAVEEVAALAIAAPPIAAAPTAAPVTSTDLMFLMSLLAVVYEEEPDCWTVMRNVRELREKNV
jgi:hypothetical protein